MTGRRYIFSALLLAACLSFGQAQTWSRKIASDLGLGYPFTYNPVTKNALYAAAGHTILYVSRDKGLSWRHFGSPVFNAGAIKSIYVSPKDTNQIVVGLQVLAGEDRILKSVDGGTSWATTWTGTFNYFGKPVECKYQHPDTMYTMSNDSLFKSIDFGSSWQLVRSLRGVINVWCDAEIHPDSANVLFIGDNTSGVWKSVDSGLNWKLVDATHGEIPSIAIDPFNPNVILAAKYGGGGGVDRSTDWGDTWQVLPTPIGHGNGWWITFSLRDSGYVYFGAYGSYPTGPFMSRDNGNSWTEYSRAVSPIDSINQFNYALFALDSLSVLALQGDGVYRLEYLPGIHLLAPNGLENWKIGETHQILWSDSNLTSVRIDFSADDGATWSAVDSALPARTGSYTWVVPNVISQHCRLRISDESNPLVSDRNDVSFTTYSTPFTIIRPAENDLLAAGTQTTLRWNREVRLPVNLYYSLDAGASWFMLGVADSDADSLVWTVPDTVAALCSIRIVSWDDSSLADTLRGYFSIVPCQSVTGTIEGNGSWSMVSLPLQVSDNAVSSLLPAATSFAYLYDTAAFVRSETLHPGRGYWIKSSMVIISGCERLCDSIPVVAGWNLIGALSRPLGTSQVEVRPAGNIVSPYYSYNGRYVADTLIAPGRAYWVKAKGTGSIILSVSPGNTPLITPIKLENGEYVLPILPNVQWPVGRTIQRQH